MQESPVNEPFKGNNMKLKRFFIFLAAAAVCLVLPCAALAAQVSITANPPSVPTEGGSVQLSISVVNNSSAAMENIVITNSGNRLFDSTGVVIQPAGNYTFSQSVSIPSSLVGQPIVFDLSWTENGEQKSDAVSVTVLGGGTDAASAAITATRTVSSSQASPGEVITLTYTVTNNGISAVSGVSITDKEIGGREPMIKDITVEPGVPFVFTYEFTMGSSTVASAPVISFLQADGTTGTINVEEKSLGMINSRIHVDVEQGVATEEGQLFTLKLTNNGNQKITKIKVVDDLGNAVSGESFALAIGESTSFTYTVPTTEARNVVFTITGTDGTGTAYSDHTKTYAVRKYIDPSLIGIGFSAEVVEPLNASGTISINFFIENTGSLVMQNLTLSERDYGTLYVLETIPQGVQTINQRMNVGQPRDLNFTLDIEDPSGNVYSYTASIRADYVGVESQATPAPEIEVEGDVISEVGSSISSALRTVLIVLIILTVIAAVAFIVLTNLEKEERKRIARRRAQRERALRQQAEEEAQRSRTLRPGWQAPGGGDTASFPPIGMGSSSQNQSENHSPSGDEGGTTRIRAR